MPSRAAVPSTILVAGHVTLDHVGGTLVPGGSAYYAAHTYRGLGVAARVATAAAPGYPAAALAGLEVDVAPAARTTTFENVYAADGTRTQRVDAAAPPLRPERLPPGWLAGDVLHLAPVVAELDLGAWLRAWRGRFVGIGVQGWVRSVLPGGAVVQPRWDVSAAELRGVDAACVGDDDVLGQGDLVERLASAVPIVAFTHGPRGCELFVRGRMVRVGAFRTEAVDPTGAGDAFAAGLFLALSAGADPADAARLGAAAASIVVEGRGGDALARVGEARERATAVPIG